MAHSSLPTQSSRRVAERDIILIVDDVPENLGVLSNYLDELGFVVRVARNGERALSIAQRHPPDLVLMDVQMPGMDGYEACARLKQDERTRAIPVIFVSARDAVEDTIRGFDVGGADFIRKPFHLKELFVRVRTHLELKKLRDMLEMEARTDAVTGITNRAGFDQALKRHWQEAQNAGASLGLVMIDIDHFKAFNDHYGHVMGDLCLRRVASVMSQAVGEAGLVARYGGEEFACLLPGATNAEALTTARAIHAGVAAMELDHGGHPEATHVSISAGSAAVVPRNGDSPKALVEQADKQLYAAKDSGRDRVVGPA